MELPDRLYGDIALDLETNDIGLNEGRGPGWCYRNGGHVAGIAIWSDNFRNYIPIGHETGPNEDPERVIRWMKSWCETTEGPPVIFANAQYDIGWIKHKLGINFKRQTHDVQYMAPLIDEHRFSYGLDALAKDFVSKDERKLDDEIEAAAKVMGIKKSQMKANLWRLPIPIVGEYAIQDVRLTKKVYDVLKLEIEKQELQKVYNLEVGLIPLLIETRKRGVRVDMDRAERERHVLKQKELDLLAEIKVKTGVNLEGDLWKAGAIAKILDDRGITYPLTPKTKKPSIDKNFLNNIDDEVCKLVLKARKYERARNVFMEEFILGYGGFAGGRLHCTLNPLKSEAGGTVSGRFSCQDPNLQQIPSADKDKEIGGLMRGLFLPEEGCLWSSLDYSQQEPRWMVEYATRLKLESGRAALEAYVTNPKTDFHTLVAELTGLPRSRAKIINLGLAYGMGGGKLCRSLGLPVIEKEWTKGGKTQIVEMAGPEGQEILRKYNEGAPFIKDLSMVCKNTANQRGRIKTALGRTFHFPLVNGERWRTHKAMNALVQGVAADETKSAMLAMWNEGIVPALTIHDEVALTDRPDARSCKRVIEIMLTALPKTVPSKVDLEMGKDWGSCELVDMTGIM